MSNPCPTLDSLVSLGFEHRKPQYGEGDRFLYQTFLMKLPDVEEALYYRFSHIDVAAYIGLNHFNVPQVILKGSAYDGRTLSVIDSAIPLTLRDASEAAAWVSFVLSGDRALLEPLPDWFIEGERHWDNFVWPIVVGREQWERQQAYKACPKCYIDRDYAVPLRNKLRTAIADLDLIETEMTVSFDGHVLSIALDGYLHEVAALGDNWPSSYRVVVSPKTRLPARFTSSTVEVSVFEGYVRLEGHRLGPYESVV